MAIGICKYCSKEFKYYPSQSPGKYCSNACQQAFQRKEAVESGNAGGIKQLRAYLVEHRVYECEECGQGGIWNGKPLTLQMDHKNGNRNDNRLENVRWLCPNCHSQSDTWGVKNASEDGKSRLRTNVQNRK